MGFMLDAFRGGGAQPYCPNAGFTSKYYQQGRIHGNPVADGWAGAVMQKPLGIQKCDGRTDLPIDLPTDTARCRVECPQLETRV